MSEIRLSDFNLEVPKKKTRSSSSSELKKTIGKVPKELSHFFNDDYVKKRLEELINMPKAELMNDKISQRKFTIYKEIFDYLINKYKPLRKRAVKWMFFSGAEGWLALWRSFNPKGIYFGDYI